MRVLFLSLAVLCVVSIAAAQTPFQLTYGAIFDDEATGLHVLPDSSIVISGFTRNYGNGGFDLFLSKLNKEGQQIWSKAYGGSGGEIHGKLAPTSDGGYLLVGMTDNFGVVLADMYIIKTDSLGVVQWSRVYGGNGSDQAVGAVQLMDGGYAITGLSNSYGFGDDDIILIKLDNLGNEVWSRAIGGVQADAGNAVVELADSSIVVAGYTTSFGSGMADFYVVRVDANGNKIWSKVYGGDLPDQANGMVATLDGGVAIVGYTLSFDNQKHAALHAYLLKLNSSGDAEWSTAFGVDNHENEAFEIIQEPDSSFLVTGRFDGFNGEGKAFTQKMTRNGQILWSTMVGQGTLNEGHHIGKALDGGIWMVGYSTGYGFSSQVSLVKLDANGHAGCTGVDALSMQRDTLPITTIPSDTFKVISGIDTAATLTINIQLDDSIVCECGVFPKIKASSTLACPGDSVYFNNLSSNATQFDWFLDNVHFTSDSNTALLFPNNGTFKVKLIASDSNCVDSTELSIVISDSILAGYDHFIEKLDVFFFDTSKFVKQHHWDFGDGDSSLQMNPKHTYADTGRYTVCLTVLNNCKSDMKCQEIYVNQARAVANFGYVVNGPQVQFLDSSKYAEHYFWEFDDGLTDTLPNPLHTYTQTGFYNVCMRVGNDCGFHLLCKNVHIDSVPNAVGELGQLSSVKVFPNPAVGLLQLTLPGTPSGPYTVRLYALDGQVVKRVENSMQPSLSIPVNDLPAALYFLQVKGADWQVTQKIEIQSR